MLEGNSRGRVCFKPVEGRKETGFSYLKSHDQLAYTVPHLPGLSVGEGVKDLPTLESLEGRISVAGPPEDHLALGPVL